VRDMLLWSQQKFKATKREMDCGVCFLIYKKFPHIPKKGRKMIDNGLDGVCYSIESNYYCLAHD